MVILFNLAISLSIYIVKSVRTYQLVLISIKGFILKSHGFPLAACLTMHKSVFVNDWCNRQSKNLMVFEGPWVGSFCYIYSFFSLFEAEFGPYLAMLRT